MTVRFYSSLDASAPVLRGSTAGDLVNLLDKCLVSGYGSRTAAGWTKPFVGTNVAAFKQGSGSNGMYLRIDDTSTAGSPRSARVVAYVVMTDVDTGTNPFPTAVQFPGGLYMHTSYSGSSSSVRPWTLVADERFFYFMVDTYLESGNASYYKETSYFGDIVSFKPGDLSATVLCVGDTSNANTSDAKPLVGTNSLTESNPGLYMARKFDELGVSIPVGRHIDNFKCGATWSGASTNAVPYPNPADSSLVMSKVWIHEPSTRTLRGTLPGLWCPCHYTSFNAYDTFAGSGDLSGKTFFAWRHFNAVQVIETSSTWR